MRILAASLLTLVFLSGCGSSGASPTPDPLVRAGEVIRVICEKTGVGPATCAENVKLLAAQPTIVAVLVSCDRENNVVGAWEAFQKCAAERTGVNAVQATINASLTGTPKP